MSDEKLPWKMVVWDLSMNVWYEPKTFVQVGTMNRGYILKEPEARRLHRLDNDVALLRKRVEKFEDALLTIASQLDGSASRWVARKALEGDE